MRFFLLYRSFFPKNVHFLDPGRGYKQKKYAVIFFRLFLVFAALCSQPPFLQKSRPCFRKWTKINVHFEKIY